MGSLEGTPVFLGCDDADSHVPKERVRLTAQVMERLGGRVTERLYKGMGHTINADESAFIRDLLESVAAAN